MFQPNVEKILGMLGENDVVLDIGAWAQPFNRANFVVDILPYDTRGIFGHSGPEPQHFNEDSWLIHDVSSNQPLPFQDKEIDFVICSHVLEDIRNPIHLPR
jgi:hypothetical protein